MNNSAVDIKNKDTLAMKNKSMWLIAGTLLLLLVLTRSNLFSHIADASWAIFFLVGFYLTRGPLTRLGFPLFFAAAFFIDLLVIDAQGGVHYCFTPSYPFLIPAYFAMWLAGRWVANHYSEDLRGMLHLVAAATSGVVLCFVISNLGFYLFGGKFEDMSAMQYVSSVAHYLPGYLKTTAVFLGAATLVHLIVRQSPALRDKLQHN